jgi:hypothetical protein
MAGEARRRRVAGWIKALAKAHEVDALRVFANREKPKETAAIAAFLDAIARDGASHFSQARMVLLDVLDVWPAAVTDTRTTAWVVEGLRELFRERAYFVFDSFISRRPSHDRKTAPARAGRIHPDEVPRWMADAALPEGDTVASLACSARAHPVNMESRHHQTFFDSLAALAKADEGWRLLDLLDVFPNYLLNREKNGWMVERLEKYLAGGLAKPGKYLRSKLPKKTPTDEDLVMLFVAGNMSAKFDPVQERLVPSGLTRSEVVDRLAKVDRSNPLGEAEVSRRKTVNKQLAAGRKSMDAINGIPPKEFKPRAPVAAPKTSKTPTPAHPSPSKRPR